MLSCARAGRSQTVRFALPAPAMVIEPAIDLEEPTDETTLWESPWLWLGAGALIAATVTIATVALLAGGTDDPVSADIMSPPL